MPQFRTGKRRSERIISVEPVRLWMTGSEDSHLAHTLDVSNHGVKVGGCRGEFKVGDKIDILFRHEHTQARVAWIIACEGSLEKRIGAEFLEPQKQVLALESSEQTAEDQEQGLRDGLIQMPLISENTRNYST